MYKCFTAKVLHFLNFYCLAYDKEVLGTIFNDNMSSKSWTLSELSESKLMLLFTHLSINLVNVALTCLIAGQMVNHVLSLAYI